MLPLRVYLGNVPSIAFAPARRLCLPPKTQRAPAAACLRRNPRLAPPACDATPASPAAAATDWLRSAGGEEKAAKKRARALATAASKAKRESKLIPNLIYQIEDYEKHLIRLSKTGVGGLCDGG
jgi:hypothetical protein